MAAAALKTFDPDLHDAVHRGRPIAAQLREARRRRDRAGPSVTPYAAGAMQEQIASLAGDIRLIAERAGVKGPTLEFILEQDHELYRRHNKQPSLDQLASRVADAAAVATRDVHEAHRKATEAQKALDLATRLANAGEAALVALGGDPRR